jgi:cobyrinic acid a,c-diamide synthase
VIGALRRRGLRVQGFKVGPDYIDPSYHALASDRPARNLDAFLSGPELIAPLARHGARGADIVVVEGVMGLFDGASGRGELASTGHVAKLLGAPVVLVVDATAMARSVAAVVHGYRTFDPEIDVAGVIFNRVGSDHHEQLLREALEPLGVPVVGALKRDPLLAAPERHLGLVPANEREGSTRAALAELAGAVARHVDLEAIVTLASAAAPLGGPAWTAEPPDAATGAELLSFDPLADEELPADAGALLLAGGFPEVFGAELQANSPLRTAVATFAASGRPILAECGGLLFLCSELDGHEMCGVLPASARMTDRLTLGYREAAAATPTPWLDAGQSVRGHEFHYTQVDSEASPSAWILRGRGGERPEGIVAGGVQASYLHVHWAAHPQLAWRFARSARVGVPIGAR